MLKKIFLVIPTIAVIALNACNLPGPTVNSVATAAAETIAAIAQEVLDNPLLPAATDVPTSDSPSASTSLPPTATTTPIPSNTPSPEPTCDLAGFITDVTIPDGTIMAPGAVFTKTWRLVNNGSCSWTSGYQLFFFSGDQMSGPSSQQLTNSIVNPGQTVDISVNLTAPGTAGTYKGNWKIKNPSGDIFALNGGNPFFVEIQVVEPSSTPVPGGPSTFTVTLTNSAAGSVRSDGTISSFPIVGDLEDNRGSQGFGQFNISSIPSNATITKIEVDFTDHDSSVGDAFGNLGCMRTFAGNYFPLNGADYENSNQLGALTRWCNLSELSTVSLASANFISELQAAVGENFFEIIIRFNATETNNDNTADRIRFRTMILKITYDIP